MFRLCLNNAIETYIYTKNIFIHPPRKSADGFKYALLAKPRVGRGSGGTMKFTFNLNKKEFSMKKAKMLSLTASLVLAITFTFSCSGDDGNESGNGGGSSSSGGGGDGNSITYGNDTYPIVVIGTQTWLAKNLNYAVTGSKCYGEGGEVYIGEDENYNPIRITLSPAEVQANCVKYGRLYDWSTAMGLPSSCNENSCSSQIQPKHKGICLSGWHIPSDDDWNLLMTTVGGDDIAGTKLKAKSGWSNTKTGSSGNGTDEFGFSALPGGIGHLGDKDGDFSNVGVTGYWHSTSEDGDAYAYAYRWRMSYNNEDTKRSDKPSEKSDLFSVRCVKD